MMLAERSVSKSCAAVISILKIKYFHEETEQFMWLHEDVVESMKEIMKERKKGRKKERKKERKKRKKKKNYS